jgi:DNA-binding NtrC family response regulator
MSTVATLMETETPNGNAACAAFAARGHIVCRAKSLDELESFVSDADCRLVLLDLDLASPGNEFFRRVKKLHPLLNILTMSERPFHPELREAMTHHICACLRKPLDIEELEFWLKTVTDHAGRAGDHASAPP